MKKFMLLLVIPILLLAGMMSVGVVGASPPTQQTSTPFVGPISFLGQVQSLPPTEGSTLPDPNGPTIGIWQIQGMRVRVSETTTIRGMPKLRSIVRVSGTVGPNGVVSAELIAVVQGRIEFTGLVQRMPDSGLIGRWVIQGLDVRVTRDTEVKGEPRLWSFVKVEGTIDADGTVLAKEIIAREAPSPKPYDSNDLLGPKEQRLRQAEARLHSDDDDHDDEGRPGRDKDRDRKEDNTDR